MPASILPLLVIVIGRARARSRARADECTFPATDQRSRTCADRGTDADTFRGLLFPGFRISVVPVVPSALAARNGNCEREGE